MTTEITALKVQLQDTQTRLQSERQQYQKVNQLLAAKEAEVECLRAENEMLQQERMSAKSDAEREALSTGDILYY